MCKYVVVDFEMCDVPKGIIRERYNCACEIIEIGAVLLDEKFNIVDSFKSYVSPQYGHISNRIHKLTRISDEDVADAPCFEDAIKMFVSWVPVDAIPVSWSDSDETQLSREAKCKFVQLPELDRFFGKWVDCQQTFSKKINQKRCYNLTEALELTGVFYEEGAHDALVDAKNTALLFAKMEQEPKLKLSEYFAECHSEHLTYSPFADLLKQFSAAV